MFISSSRAVFLNKSAAEFSLAIRLHPV